MDTSRSLVPATNFDSAVTSAAIVLFSGGEQGAGASTSALKADGAGNAPTALSSPLALLLGTPGGPDIATTLSRGDVLFRPGGADQGPEGVLDGTPAGEKLAGDGTFLLDQGPSDLLLEPDTLAAGSHPLRDTADLLPMRERTLALVATLFSDRDSAPGPVQTGNPRAGEGEDQLATLPERLFGTVRGREPAGTPALTRTDAALINFVAGVNPTAPAGKARDDSATPNGSSSIARALVQTLSTPGPSWHRFVQRYLRVGLSTLSEITNWLPVLRGDSTSTALPGSVSGRTAAVAGPSVSANRVSDRLAVPDAPQGAGRWTRSWAALLCAAAVFKIRERDSEGRRL